METCLHCFRPCSDPREEVLLDRVAVRPGVLLRIILEHRVGAGCETGPKIGSSDQTHVLQMRMKKKSRILQVRMSRDETIPPFLRYSIRTLHVQMNHDELVPRLLRLFTDGSHRLVVLVNRFAIEVTSVPPILVAMHKGHGARFRATKLRRTRSILHEGIPLGDDAEYPCRYENKDKSSVAVHPLGYVCNLFLDLRALSL